MVSALASLVVTIVSPTAFAGSFCQELFRPMPELESILGARGPNRTRILKAIEADVLGLTRRSQRASYEIQSWFELLHLQKSRTDDALVEFHRRQFDKVLESRGQSARYDFQARLQDAKPFFSTMFSVAANGAVNYLSYTYLGTAGVIIHVPHLRTFDARKVPDDVLVELLGAKPSDATPKTRAFINAKVKHGADAVFQAVRRIFNFSIIAVAAVFYADMIIDPMGTMERQMNAASTTLYEVANEQNRATLRLVLEKRALFVARGDLDSVAAADALIAEILSSQEARKNRNAQQDRKLE